MARVTVEDCLKNIHNRFDLILVASKRAHQVARGISEPMVNPDHDKPTVIALREIADGLVGRDILNQPERENPKFQRAELNLSSGHGF
ncbi:DNA-directed RNA polymerase subunit omega [Moraxella macacae]|nr:DNA-directed RNA polymerase subunit omega [Moraxella macacae]